jgi:hypothetical protein
MKVTMNKKSESARSKEFTRFQKSFFEEYDPYIAWHDGISTIIDIEALKSLSGEEKEEAEKLLIESLMKSFDERWVHGLVEIASLKGLDLIGDLYEQDFDPAHRIVLAEAIMMQSENDGPLQYFLELLQADAGESTKIDVLTAIKKLIGTGRWKAPPPALVDNLFRAMHDESYLVRAHAYEAILNLYNVERPPVQDDEIFGLIVGARTQRDFDEAEKMLRKKTGQFH